MMVGRRRKIGGTRGKDEGGGKEEVEEWRDTGGGGLGGNKGGRGRRREMTKRRGEREGEGRGGGESKREGG